MAVEYRLSGDLAALPASGVVRIPDFISALHLAIKDSQFIPGSRIITDENNATYETTEVESNEAAFFMKSFKDIFANRVAAIARSPLNFSMIKMIEETCRNHATNFRAFDDESKAYKWIEGNTA